MAEIPILTTQSSQERADLVAFWSVPLCDGVHTVEFEHGTTSGKRVIRVNGKEILHQDWMFKLVGEENFQIGPQQTKCTLKIDPLPYFTYSYSLWINGKPLEEFIEKQGKALCTWSVVSNGKRYQVALEKQTLDIWVNGTHADVENLFAEDGTEMRFLLGCECAIIKIKKQDDKSCIIYQLYLAGKLVESDLY